MLPLLAVALAAAPAAPRLLVVSPEAELARAASAALTPEDAELTPRLEGSAPCGEPSCAREQGLQVSAK